MARHKFVSAVGDGGDATLVQPGDWNDPHVADASSFPGSPATNELCFRSDLGMEFYYNGTRWLSSSLLQVQLTSMDANLPLSIGNRNLRANVPLWAGSGPSSDIWLIGTQTWFYISGGSALSGSHKWDFNITKQPSTTSLATFSINSGSSNTHRQSSIVAINSLLGSTDFELEAVLTSTGTPGSIYAITTVTFRYVAT